MIEVNVNFNLSCTHILMHVAHFFTSVGHKVRNSEIIAKH